MNNNDGWEDAANDASARIIRGAILKFSDGQWTTGREGTVVERGTKLVALGTTAAWVKWWDNKPVEYKLRVAGQRMLDREELGDDEEGEWQAGPGGGLRDPWQNTRFVYLVDPLTAEAYTFSTASWSGRSAVIDLGDQIARMRLAHPGAVPVVALESAPHLTKYGRKTKPVFKVVGWRKGGSVEDEPQPLQIEHQSKPATKHPVADALDDQIPW
jgi:hypothetical protein